MIYLLLPILTLPYFILLLALYKALLRIREFRRSSSDPFSFISVVVACRNEQDNLPDLLVALSRQEYPLNLYEVIVVDDHSTDMTVAAARSYEYLLNLKVITSEGKGKKHALRKGISAAKGDLIVTTDADCSPKTGWLAAIASFYESSKPDLIICPVQLNRAKGFFGWFQELEFLSLQGITAAAASSDNAVMCNGAGLAFTKAAYFENVEDLRFDIATGDDVFLLHSMKRKKSKICWLESEDATVFTEEAPDLRSFFRQRKRWASKSTAYRDGYSIFLGIVTFVTNLIMVVLFTGAFFSPDYFKGFIIAFFIKSVPDFLILSNVTSRYGRRNLMWWFLPAQIVYPFYVLIVVFFALANFPSRRET